MATDAVIVTTGLTRHFGEIVAVDHLTMEVSAGEVFGILGHNGAGKTTTIRLLNGILAASDGTCQVLDLDPLNEGPDLRRRTGILTETPSLDERLTGRDNLQIYADIYGIPREEVSGRVEEMLSVFELADRADEQVGDYSKGMKQRLALARALLHRPDILFLDEPTAGLDPVGSRRVHEMISRLSAEEGRTVLLCTHNLAEAQKLCNRVAVLEHGRLVALGTPEELILALGRTMRLEIEVAAEGKAAAAEIVRASLGISEIAQENGRIAITGVNREQVPELVSSLVAANVRVYRIAPQEPTLEDVYFALHGEGEGVS